MSAGYLGGEIRISTYGIWVGGHRRRWQKALGLGGVCDILEGVIYKGSMSELQRVSV